MSRLLTNETSYIRHLETELDMSIHLIKIIMLKRYRAKYILKIIKISLLFVLWFFFRGMLTIFRSGFFSLCKITSVVLIYFCLLTPDI